jgi:DNA-binding NarL/FixJ family response regulator
MGYYFDERVNRVLVEGFVENHKIKPKFKKVNLSEKEIQIIKLICKEHTSKEISQKLFMSLKTVERHRDDMLKKVGARNVVGLVMFAVQNNLHNKFIRSSFNLKKRL